ncbi:MAG TPA: phospholipase D-like domain-containing protein [Atribacterota bacterium]|nr:phospholipase D-like domain-containing protein [Atribacterota bacterium]
MAFTRERKNFLTYFTLLSLCILVLFSFPISAKTRVYFSLYDDPESVIIEHLSKAEESIYVAMYYFTDSQLAREVVKAKNKGVEVRIYLDSSQINAQYSKARFFVNERIENIRISSNRNLMHNKFAIIDKTIVLTGSYNWTASASERNDENLLVIDDEEIVTRYMNYFNTLWEEKHSPEKYHELLNHPGVHLIPEESEKEETKD